MQVTLIKALCLPVFLICLLSSCKQDSNPSTHNSTAEKPKADTVNFKKAPLKGAVTYTVTGGT